MEKSKLLRLFQYALCLALLPLFSACGEDAGDDGSELEINVEQSASTDSISGPSTERAMNSLGEVDDLTSDTETETSGTTGETYSGTSVARSTETSDAQYANPKKSTASERAGTRDERENTEYDPAIWDALLRKYVRNGRVNYAGFRDDRNFSSFVNSLSTADPGSMNTNEALAFWINAYNALVVKNVLDHPGTDNPLDVKGFFDGIRFDVAKRSLTLNGIENDVVRPTYKEPLIHFGLVCAAVSCPPLIPKAYTGANVRSALAENAQNYLGNSRQNRFEESSGTLFLSKIFEWYKVDFGNSDEGVIEFVREHAPPELVTRLNAADRVNVRYVEYDWSLNDL